MSHLIDITGQRFGKLTAIEKTPINPKRKKALWKCVCDCGNEMVVSGSDLRTGRIRSCGCSRRDKMSHLIDMTGQRFGKLTVIEKMPPKPKSKQSFWRCLCDCGNERVVTGSALRRGFCQSCGCTRREKVELVYIKNDPDWKKKKERKYKTCPYNDACRCSEATCKRCGWNPKVAKARMERMGYGN